MPAAGAPRDRKSTRLNSQSRRDLVCRLLLEKKKLSPCVITSVNPAPVVTTVQHHSGTRSALLGTVSGSEPFGNSSFYQQITVRAGGGTLSLLVAARDTEGAISQHARAPAHGRAASALPRLRQSEWLYS